MSCTMELGREVNYRQDELQMRDYKKLRGQFVRVGKWSFAILWVSASIWSIQISTLSVEDRLEWAKNLPWIAALASLFTATISLVGVVTTTILTWRKDVRDKAAAALGNAKTSLEIEKLSLELGKLRSEQVVVSVQSDDVNA